jgi:hypothetical protein
MCYTSEISAITLAIGLIGSAAVYNLGSVIDHIIAIFFGYVSLMQGIEWFLWNHQTCDQTHKNVSVMGMLLNFGQPLVLGGVILALSAKKDARMPIIAVLILYALYGIFFYVNQYTSELQCTTPHDNDPHLVWNWTVMKNYETAWAAYIIAVIAVLMLGMPTLTSKLVFSGVMLFTMISSIQTYDRKYMGALWCFSAASTPVVYYMFRTLGFRL